jgi:epsilon-lactone hydrolase
MNATARPSIVVLCAAVGVTGAAIAQQPRPDLAKPYAYVPDTVSREAQELLRKATDPALRPPMPAPDDRQGWKEVQARREDERRERSAATIARYRPTLIDRKLGGTPVLEIRPRGWKDNGKLLVHIHGGSWVSYSPRSTIDSSAPVADRTGLRIISIDYTLAPRAKWKQVQDEIVAVIKALMKEGIALQNIALYGESAGGNLTAAVTLKLRDLGLGMPAAVVLWSPCTDFADTADTRITLRAAEPTYLYDRHLRPAMLAYADASDWRNPYVSPVRADFRKGFPPALIQAGTREIFLSDAVRLYQALDAAGIEVKLDVYEGMTHVFQRLLAEAPEGALALTKMKTFLERHLGR